MNTFKYILLTLILFFNIINLKGQRYEDSLRAKRFFYWYQVEKEFTVSQGFPEFEAKIIRRDYPYWGKSLFISKDFIFFDGYYQGGFKDKNQLIDSIKKYKDLNILGCCITNMDITIDEDVFKALSQSFSISSLIIQTSSVIFPTTMIDFPELSYFYFTTTDPEFVAYYEYYNYLYDKDMDNYKGPKELIKIPSFEKNNKLIALELRGRFILDDDWNLPISISKLMLDRTGYGDLETLPKFIENYNNLIHLSVVGDFDSLNFNIRKLTNLESLEILCPDLTYVYSGDNSLRKSNLKKS